MISDEYPDLDGSPEDSEDGPSELVRRLKHLRWPEVSPEVRQSCWEELSREVAALGKPTPRGEPSPGIARPVDDYARAAYRRARQRRFWGRDNPDAPGGRRFGRHNFAGNRGEGLYRGALAQRVAVARGTTGPRLSA